MVVGPSLPPSAGAAWSLASAASFPSGEPSQEHVPSEPDAQICEPCAPVGQAQATLAPSTHPLLLGVEDEHAAIAKKWLP